MKSSRTLPLALAACLAIQPLAMYAQTQAPVAPVPAGQTTAPAGQAPAGQAPAGQVPAGQVPAAGQASTASTDKAAVKATTDKSAAGSTNGKQSAASKKKGKNKKAQKKGTDTIQSFDNTFDTGGDIKQPWDNFKFSKTKKVKLNFRNASPDNVLSFLSTASGITIIKDPSLKDPLTVTTASRVSLSDAFSILNTYLGLKNFAIYKNANLLVVKPKQDAPAAPAFDPSALAAMQQNNKAIIKVYPIQYANASEVARIVEDVFAPSGQNNNNNFFNPFGGGRGFRGGGGRFGGGIQFSVGGPPGADGGGQREPNVKASSDDFSNAVIVRAPQQDQDEVEKFIHQIDKQTEQPIIAQVYKLKYAIANDIAPAVQNVLVSTAPKGKGGTGQQQPSFGQQFGTALRFGTAAASFGNVVADQRSNSLVVSATAQNQSIVNKLIDELDKPVVALDTTAIIQLHNAKADTIAQLMQNAFGNRQGFSGTGFNQNQQTQRATQTIQNRQGATNTGGANSALGGDNSADPNNPANASASIDPAAQALNLALQNPTGDNGELLTTIAAQGFGGGGGFFRALGGQGAGGGSSSSGTGTSRDPNGQIVPTRELAGQITVIPDVNTNSVIVVTPPEYIETVKKILAQLDKIPDQVVIETLIVETNLTRTDQFGFEWKAAQNKFFGEKNARGTGQTDFGNQTGATLPQGLRYSVTGGSISTFLNMLQTDTKFNVLSTPRIFTSNNQTAEINVSQRVPYIVSTRFDTNNNPTYTYGYENVGVVLTVTPRITSSGSVSLDVDQQDNDLDHYTSFNAPVINQREANTSVTVKDGKTLVLGGIIRDTLSSTVNKVPLVGDLPLIGNFFRSSTKTKQRTEVLIFLTPHIIRADEDADAYREKTLKDMAPEIKNSVNQILHLSKKGGSPSTDGNSKGTNS